MNRLVLVVFLVSLIFESQQQDALKSCFNKIKELANQDKCLSSRLPQKKEAGKVANNPTEFVNFVNKFQKCNGTYYVCGNK